MAAFDTASLREHQIPHAIRLATALNKPGFPFALDSSDTGTGKTYSAVSLVRHFKAPTLAVCPVALRPSWERVGEQLGGEVTTVGYEMLRTGRSEFGQWTTMSRPGSTAIRYFKFDPAIKFLILDEFHRCRGFDTLNHHLAIGAKLCGIPTLAMTATPAESPVHMRALGYLMGWFDYFHFFGWARAHNCIQDLQHRWRFVDTSRKSRTQVMDELSNQMLERGARLRVSEIPGFPKNQVIPQLYEFPGAGKIEALYREMDRELAKLKARAAEDKDPEHGLTKDLRQRQLIELLKVPAFISLAQDEIAQGRSVVMFVNFRGTIDALAARLAFLNPAIIHGDTEDVESERLRFQNNETFLAICQADTGGIGLSFQDLYGRPRTSLIGPVWSAITFRQILGRICRDGAVSSALQRIILAAKTREVTIFCKLMEKKKSLDAFLGDGITDDDLQAAA